MLLATKRSQYKSEITPLCTAALRPAISILPSEREMSWCAFCGEIGEAARWIKPTCWAQRCGLFAADLQRVGAGTDTHACGRQKVKTCMQWCYIHTLFGGFPCSHLTPPPPPPTCFEQWACFHSHPHTAALDSPNIKLTFICIVFASQEVIIHVKQLLDYSEALLLTAINRRIVGRTRNWSLKKMTATTLCFTAFSISEETAEQRGCLFPDKYEPQNWQKHNLFRDSTKATYNKMFYWLCFWLII